MRLVATQLAALREMPLEQLAEAAWQNAHALISDRACSPCLEGYRVGFCLRQQCACGSKDRNMVATSRSLNPALPWFMRWNLPVILLAAAGCGDAVVGHAQHRRVELGRGAWHSDAGSLACAGGRHYLRAAGLAAGLVLAHLPSAALGLAWAVQSSGSPALVREVGRELGAPLGARLVSWGDFASEIVIRAYPAAYLAGRRPRRGYHPVCRRWRC